MKLKSVFIVLIITSVALQGCNQEEKTEAPTVKEQESVKCGYCNKEMYDGQPAIGTLTSDKYFCSTTCADMYSVYR
jgi:hypothetical protein